MPDNVHIAGQAIKEEQGDSLGLKVEIGEVLTDKREPAACIKSLSSSELLAASPSALRLLKRVLSWVPNRSSRHTPFFFFFFFFFNTTGVGNVFDRQPSLKTYKPNVRLQNNFQCSNQLVSLWSTINQCCQEQDANLWESYTSSPQAADKKKKKTTKNKKHKMALLLCMWNEIKSKTNS